ncbi:TPA: hypothetical protein R5X36_004014 [Enterobacter sichuanensis]|nr:hypothetical protein [Enterobacter sichuanensis]
MDEFNAIYTTRHRLLRRALISTLNNEPWLILHGAKGAGKSLLAQGIVTAWAHRALTLGLLTRKGYQQEWIVLADTQIEGGLTGRVFSFGALWSGLSGVIGEMKEGTPLFVLENGQRAGNRLVSTVQDFIAIMPNARLLLTGTFGHRLQRRLRKLHPVWFEIPFPDKEDCREVIAAHADIEREESGVLAERFVREVMRRCHGNLHLVARTGEFIRRNKEEQAAVAPAGATASRLALFTRDAPSSPDLHGVNRRGGAVWGSRPVFFSSFVPLAAGARKPAVRRVIPVRLSSPDIDIRDYVYQ